MKYNLIFILFLNALALSAIVYGGEQVYTGSGFILGGLTLTTLLNLGSE